MTSIFAIFLWQTTIPVEIGKIRNFERLPIAFPNAQGFNQGMGTFLERRWTFALKSSSSFREASRRYLCPLPWLFKHIRKLCAVDSWIAAPAIGVSVQPKIVSEFAIASGRLVR